MAIEFNDALKAKQLRKYFDESGRIFIVVDATSDDVLVPEHLRGDPGLRLVLNARMPQPIYIRDAFLESNFSFGGMPHHCVIPMRCIWAAYLPDEDMSTGLVWEKDMPETIRMMLGAIEDEAMDEGVVAVQAEPRNAASAVKSKGTKIRHLRVVK